MKVARLEDLSEQKIKILEEVIRDCQLAITHPSDWGQISRAESIMEMRDAMMDLVIQAMENTTL